MLRFLKANFASGPFFLVFFFFVAVAFLFFTDLPSGSLGNEGVLGKIDNRPIRPTDFQQEFSKTDVLFTMYRGGSPVPRNQAVIIQQQTWNRLVLNAAAKDTGYSVSNQEVVDVIIDQPLFQGNGGFSKERYDLFATNVLLPNGMSKEDFNETIRDSELQKNFRAAIESTTVVLPSEVEEELMRTYGSNQVELVKVDAADVAKSVETSDENLKKYYELKTSAYDLPEKRNFKYIVFLLGAEERILRGVTRQAEMRRLDEQAYRFVEKFTEAARQGKELPDFEALAAAEGVEVKITDFFSSREQIPGINVNPASRITASALSSRVFALSEAEPVSAHLPVEDGFAVFMLNETQAAVPQEFEKVKAQVKDDYLAYRTQVVLSERIAALKDESARLASKGTDWDTIKTTLELKAEPLPEFTLNEGNKLESPEAGKILVQIRKTDPGKVSDTWTASDNSAAFFLFLKERAAAELAEREDKLKEIRQKLRTQRRQLVLYEWLFNRYTSAGNELPEDFLKAMGVTL